VHCPRDGGGVLITQAIHTLDLFQSLAGPITRVSAMAVTSPLRRIDTEDIAAVAVGFANGAIGTIDATTVRSEARLDARHPIVFLNACESGRLGRSLTAWSGWPRTFWDAGAGAFIGTSWPVRDVPARAFCDAFYGSLLNGDTLASAASAGRAAAKAKGDATWLAYKVYGRPAARKE